MKHNAPMGLINRIFKGKDKDQGGGPDSSQFYESEPDSTTEQSRNAPRRELVQVVLRDTMRKHGVPSDWIECRVLSTISRSGRPGLHLNFVVKTAHHQMLGYVFAFQHSFEREIARFEPRARDWLMSVAWEFQDFKVEDLPAPKSFAASGPAPLVDLKEASGARSPELAHETPYQAEERKNEEDVARDLQALFAIRDAALADASGKPPPPGHGDFQPTEPFRDPRKPN